MVGGLVIHGRTVGDIDILVNEGPDASREFKHVLQWRILRSLPPEFRDRVQFIYDEVRGPITDFIELYDLTLERVNPTNQIPQMSLPLELLSTDELLAKAEELTGRRHALTRRNA